MVDILNNRSNYYLLALKMSQIDDAVGPRIIPPHIALFRYCTIFKWFQNVSHCTIFTIYFLHCTILFHENCIRFRYLYNLPYYLHISGRGLLLSKSNHVMYFCATCYPTKIYWDT